MISLASCLQSAENHSTVYLNRNGISHSAKTTNSDAQTFIARTSHRLIQKVLTAESHFRNTRVRRSADFNMEMQLRRQTLEKFRLGLRNELRNRELHGATQRLGNHAAELLNKLIVAETFFRDSARTDHSLERTFWGDMRRDALQMDANVKKELEAGSYVGSQPDLFKEFSRVMRELVFNMRTFNHTLSCRGCSELKKRMRRDINESMHKLETDITTLRSRMQASWTLCRAEKNLLILALNLMQNSQHFLEVRTD